MAAVRMVIAMITTSTDPNLALLRLMQLISPSLPVGGFTYSQGIEWAVDAAGSNPLLTWTPG